MRVVADFRTNLLLLHIPACDAYAAYIITNRLILIKQWLFFCRFLFSSISRYFHIVVSIFGLTNVFFFFLNVMGDYSATTIRERVCTTHESISSSYKTATWRRSRTYIWTTFGDLLIYNIARDDNDDLSIEIPKCINKATKASYAATEHLFPKKTKVRLYTATIGPTFDVRISTTKGE